MIPAIGQSALIPSYSTGGAGLQGQLARYEQELSACVNCASAQTSEGKQKILAISRQIEQIKARIEQAAQTRATLRAENNNALGISGLNVASGANSASSDFGSQPQSPLGGLIDVVV